MSCGLGWPSCPDASKDNYFKPGHDPGIKSIMPEAKLCKYCQRSRFAASGKGIECRLTDKEVPTEKAATCPDFDDWRRYMGKGAEVSWL